MPAAASAAAFACLEWITPRAFALEVHSHSTFRNVSRVSLFDNAFELIIMIISALQFHVSCMPSERSVSSPMKDTCNRLPENRVP